MTTGVAPSERIPGSAEQRDRFDESLTILKQAIKIREIRNSRIFQTNSETEEKTT